MRAEDQRRRRAIIERLLGRRTWDSAALRYVMTVEAVALVLAETEPAYARATVERFLNQDELAEIGEGLLTDQQVTALYARMHLRLQEWETHG